MQSNFEATGSLRSCREPVAVCRDALFAVYRLRCVIFAFGVWVGSVVVTAEREQVFWRPFRSRGRHRGRMS